MNSKQEINAYIEEIKRKNPSITNTEIAQELITTQIAQGIIQQGDRLKQESLADLYGINRTSIRDALLKLLEEGLVMHNDNGGFSVCQISLKDYLEFILYREVIEVKAAFLAARTCTKEERILLIENLNKTKAVCDNEKLSLLFDLDDEFHELVVTASHNKYLISSYKNYAWKRDFYNRMVLSENSLPAVYNKHAKIVSAILANDENAAKEAMKSHLSMNTLIYNLANI